MKSVRPIPVIFFAFLLIPATIYPQVVLKNPANPSSRDYGRIVQLKEVLRIKDDGKNTSFRAPYDLLMGKNGEILFYDNFVLYKFDKNGQRLAAMVRSGQGPGEATRRTSAVFAGENIQVLALSPPKVMIFDGAGRLQQEIKTEALRELRVCQYWLKVLGVQIPRINPDGIPMAGGESDMPISLEELESDFSRTIKIAEFPRRYYFVNRSIWYEWSGFGCAVKKPDHLFIHHTSEYRIVEFNTTSKKIERIFSRGYSRVSGRTSREKLAPESNCLRGFTMTTSWPCLSSVITYGPSLLR